MSTHIVSHVEILMSAVGEPLWFLFANMRLPVDSKMFGAMAGVRNPDMQMYPLRGMPEGAALPGEYRLQVVDDVVGQCPSGCVEKSVAEAAIAEGRSELLVPGDEYVLPQISDPDAHHASWLYCDEFERVVETVRPNELWYVAVRMMRDLERVHGDRAVRLVFFFH